MHSSRSYFVVAATHAHLQMLCCAARYCTAPHLHLSQSALVSSTRCPLQDGAGGMSESRILEKYIAALSRTPPRDNPSEV